MLSLRALLRHPWQVGLMVLGIALGVAVMVGIDIANASSARAFALSTDAVVGKATHQIVGGSPYGVPESLYAHLRTDPLWRERTALAPVINVPLTSAQLGGDSFTLLGLDPLAEAPFRAYFGGQQPVLETLAVLLTVPDAVLVSEDVAARYGLSPCDPSRPAAACRLRIDVQGRQHEVFLAGVLHPEDAFTRRALDTLVIADIGTTQALTGQYGRLSRIDLILSDEAALRELQAALPAGTRLLSAATRGDSIRQMTAAFRTNLTALSLLALVVGVFLIYNTMTFSVVQRRPLFGTLRCLGITRRQVFWMVLREAALLGFLGSLLGVGLGVLLGQGAVRLVTRTINDLFFVLDVRGVQLPLSSLLKGWGSGVLAALLAAAPPAWEAASVPPHMALSRAGLEDKANMAVNLAALWGAALVLVGVLILRFGSAALVTAFGGTFVLVIGLAMLTALGTRLLVQLAAHPLGRVGGLRAQMAARSVVRGQSRTAVALAALMIAVAVTIGVQVMVLSFRTTVALWLEQTLQGDLYISAPEFSGARLGLPLPVEVPSLVAHLPGVEAHALLRTVTLEAARGPVEVAAVSDYRRTSAQLFLSADGTPAELWAQMQQGAVTVSEPLANRWGIPPHGGRVRLLTPQGWRDFPVVGIFSDYSSTQGSLRMSLAYYRAVWSDPAVTGVALYLAPGADGEAVAAQARAALAGFPALDVRSSAALRTAALAVFDRTFAITQAMQLLTTLVAFIGVASALLAVELDKQREAGILRALGLTPAEMCAMVLWETGLMGAAAGLLAQPVGLALAWILIYIINRRSFGWTLQLYTPPAPFVQALLVAVLAALLAGGYPALRLGRMVTAEALRLE
ncbi:MAG: FtsX-like permease family protein [Anaerolineales bacterium]